MHEVLAAVLFLVAACLVGLILSPTEAEAQARLAKPVESADHGHGH